MEKLHLLYITNARIPTEKAHGLQIIRTISALAEAGVDVTLAVPKRFNHIAEDPFTFYGVEPSFILVKLPMHFQFLEKIWPNGYFRLLNVQFVLRAILYAVFSKANFVYTRNITLAFLLSLIASGKTVIYEDHEPKRSKKFLYAFFLRHIDKKVIVSQGLAALYEQYGVQKESYVCIPNGVSLEDVESIPPQKDIWNRELGVPRNNLVVLYMGHFYQWKGIYTLIEAATFLGSNISVVLIGGTSEDGKKIRTYVAERQLQNVYVHDFQPHKKVIAFMRSADVLVLPNTAKEERSSLYTTPIKLFEYMASGVPIAGSNLESLSWYLHDGENSILFTPDDPSNLAQKVTTLLKDTELKERISRQALIDGQAYTWNSRAKHIINFIQPNATSSA